MSNRTDESNETHTADVFMTSRQRRIAAVIVVTLGIVSYLGFKLKNGLMETRSYLAVHTDESTWASDWAGAVFYLVALLSFSVALVAASCLLYSWIRGDGEKQR